jgi:pimeloyl-ACP methyl ester carboxylesterase
MGHSLGGLSATLAFKQLTNQLARRLVIIAPATETWRSIDHFLGLFSADEKLKQAFLELLKELTHEPIVSISVSDAVNYIQSPILWIHDKQDKICVFEDVQTMIDKKIPNIKFHITQGLGHSFVYKEAQVSNEIVQFFKEGIN